MKSLYTLKGILATITALLILWEILTRLNIINPIFLPPPTRVFLAFPTYADEILIALAVTLRHIGLGYSLGAAFGISIGAISGWYRVLDVSLGTLVNAFYPIPRITYLPLFILWFGYNETPIMVIVGLAVFFPTFINTLSGVKKTDIRLIEVGRNLSGRKIQIFQKIVFPSALPHITSGLRLGIGRSITSAIAAEMLIGLMGLGGVIYLAGEFFKPEVIILSQMFLALLGLALYRIFDVVEYKYLLGWMPRAEQ